MIEPLPKAFSIWRIAASIAFVFSVTSSSPYGRSLRFGFTTSKVIGSIGRTVACRLASLASCSLDFFFWFLVPPSPRPLGMPHLRRTDWKRRRPGRAYPAGTARQCARMPARKAAARVTTRTGDRGTTSLFGPGRVSKTDPRIMALGDLDEAQAAMGVCRAAERGKTAAVLLALQRGVYVVMSEVATPRARRARLSQRIDAASVAELDALAATL
ncbi:MAG: ATP:cob(I)alamin adenosyltransferase, partial [Chloroflexi bacterium]|nr:ATP:cob(I)alamin adenosyltransferase [Chloroflexota bacterium]